MGLTKVEREGGRKGGREREKERKRKRRVSLQQLIISSREELAGLRFWLLLPGEKAFLSGRKPMTKFRIVSN